MDPGKDQKWDDILVDNAKVPRRRKPSPVLKYYNKNSDGNYKCKLCTKRDVVVKRDKTGSTMKLWTHLERHHLHFHRKLKGSTDMKDFTYEKPVITSKYTGRDPDKITEALLDLISGTDLPFSIIDNPKFQKFCGFWAQCDVTLPSSTTIQRAACQKFEAENAKMKEFLRPIENVSLTMDTWITSNHGSILGTTVHWIDDAWQLRERVLFVRQLIGSHQGAYLAGLLNSVLREYDLTHKVCAITNSNAADNEAMLESLERYWKDSGSTLTNHYHASSMLHVLNLSVQRGFKALGAVGSEDYEDDESNTGRNNMQISFKHILFRLRKLITASRASSQSIHHYQNLCNELGMNDMNLLIEDVPNRWNSTYDMIEAAWEKRKVLDKMANDYLSTYNINYSIMAEEWDILKKFADELSPFREVTQVISQSNPVTVSLVLEAYQLLLDQLQSAIDQEDNPIEAVSGLPIFRNAYIAMKEKLVEYQPNLAMKPMYSIATVLDPRTKLESIDVEERPFIIDTIVQFLDRLLTSSPSCDQTTIKKIPSKPKRSKVMVEKCSKSLALKTTRAELDEYLNEPCIDYKESPLKWWQIIGSPKYPRMAALAKQFLHICTSSASSKRLCSAGRGIVTFKRRRLNPEDVSVLMTIKCWASENDEETVDDDEKWMI